MHSKENWQRMHAEYVRKAQERRQKLMEMAAAQREASQGVARDEHGNIYTSAVQHEGQAIEGHIRVVADVGSDGPRGIDDDPAEGSVTVGL